MKISMTLSAEGLFAECCVLFIVMLSFNILNAVMLNIPGPENGDADVCC
jgi:hypothetical protein